MTPTPQTDQPSTALDALWTHLWDELRLNAADKPSGEAIIRKHRRGIEAEARADTARPSYKLAEKLADALHVIDLMQAAANGDEHAAFDIALRPSVMRKWRSEVDRLLATAPKPDTARPVEPPAIRRVDVTTPQDIRNEIKRLYGLAKEYREFSARATYKSLLRWLDERVK